MKLTQLQIDKAKAKDKPYKLTDGIGLYLYVTPSGGKLWRMNYYFERKRKTLSFGKYPYVSLLDARNKAFDAKKVLAEGQDPSQLKKEKKQASGAPSFEAVARQFLDRQHKANAWTEYYAWQQERRFELDVFPHLGDAQINEIQPPDIIRALKPMEQRGATELARRVKGLCSQVFRFGVAHGYCPSDPTRDLTGVFTAHKSENMACIDAKELPELLDAMDQYDGKPVTRLGLQLLALTFVRTSELIQATWDEFDFDAMLWTIPAERMKMKDRFDHVVPLSYQSKVVLDELHIHTGHSPYVLQTRSSVQKPVSNMVFLSALWRMGYKGKMTGHGFRALASTVLNESGLWSPDAIERQLAHVPSNQIRAAYNKAKYLDERRKMMQWWADYLDKARANHLAIAAE